MQKLYRKHELNILTALAVIIYIWAIVKAIQETLMTEETETAQDFMYVCMICGTPNNDWIYECDNCADPLGGDGQDD